MTGTLDQFIPDNSVSLSTQKHNLCGGLGLLADVSSWSFSTLNTSILSLSFSRLRTHVEEIERFEKASAPPFRHLQHNSPEEDRVSHLETSSAAHY